MINKKTSKLDTFAWDKNIIFNAIKKKKVGKRYLVLKLWTSQRPQALIIITRKIYFSSNFRSWSCRSGLMLQDVFCFNGLMSKTDVKFVWIAKLFFFFTGNIYELSVNTDSIMLARPPCLFNNHHHYYDYRLIGVLAPAVSLIWTCLSNQLCWVHDVSWKCELPEDLITALFCFTGRKMNIMAQHRRCGAKQAYSRCSNVTLNSD